MADDPSFWPLSGVNLAVSMIRCFDDTGEIANATGFFFRHENRKFLATNRHVVIDEAEDYFPNRLEIRIHTDRSNPKKTTDVSVDLYNVDRKMLWLEHPEVECDIVLIPFQEDRISTGCMNFITTQNLPDEKVSIPCFGDVVVVGYPLGFHDEENYLPVYRQGMIASPYPTMFEDEPCFLIDARLHEGSSGSPVLNSPHNILTNDKGAFHSSNTILLGVFSADYDFDGNGGNDPLGLNKVWYSFLLPQIAVQALE